MICCLEHGTTRSLTARVADLESKIPNPSATKNSRGPLTTNENDEGLAVQEE